MLSLKPRTFEILQYLAECKEGGLTASYVAIGKRFGIGRATVAVHVGILRKAGFAAARRGNSGYIRITPKGVGWLAGLKESAA